MPCFVGGEYKLNNVPTAHQYIKALCRACKNLTYEEMNGIHFYNETTLGDWYESHLRSDEYHNIGKDKGLAQYEIERIQREKREFRAKQWL